MTHDHHLPRRCLLLALVGAMLLLSELGTARAGAAVYGGLGRVGAGVIKPGTGGKGQVDPTAGHNFAVDSKTGDFFIAEEFTEAGHNLVRIQAFGPKGEFLAENRVKLGTTIGSGLGGLAVDAEKNRLYMLEVRARPLESEAIEEQIGKKEEQIGKKEELIKEKEAKHEEVTKLKEEVTKLKKEVAELEEEKPVFDPGLNAASQIYSFSTETKEEKLKEQKTLTPSSVLNPTSETEKVALVNPAGIAVNPKSHELVLVGQQDESSHKGPGEEELRAAVQRVSTENGSLGPRYIDQADCLDGGLPSAVEPACAEKGPRENRPGSPIITSAGKVYVEVTGTAGEIWEIPASGGAGDVAVQPKRVFTLSNEQEQEKLVNFSGGEEVPDTMSFVQVGPNEGRIYVDANVEGNLSAVMVLNYVEHGESAEVTERGWTGGQSSVSSQEQCTIPAANHIPLLGAGSGENMVTFETRPEREGAPALIDVMGFGPGGEACGHVTVTPPTVEFGENKNATEVPTGKSTTLTSKVEGANAKGVKWKFKFKAKNGEEGEELGPFESGDQFETTSLNHDFTHVGEYKITEIVETDNLGTPTVELEPKTLTVTASSPKVQIKAPTSVVSGESVAFEATVTDENEATPHLKYTWSFGDGSAPVKEEETSGTAKVVRKVEHAFVSRCGGTCVVTLEVKDNAGESKVVKIEVPVAESAAEIAARKKAEEEAAVKKQAEEAARRKAEEEAAARNHAEEAAAAKHAEEEAAAKHKAEEEAAAKKRQEEEKAKSKPLTRAQVLAKALKSCKKQSKKKRAKCEATARKKYGSKAKGKKKK